MDTHTFACLRGDVNEDSVVGVDDLTELINYMLGINTKVNLINADVDLDGTVSMSDLSVLINMLLQI